jgi:hypothetical protein
LHPNPSHSSQVLSKRGWDARECRNDRDPERKTEAEISSDSRRLTPGTSNEADYGII